MVPNRATHHIYESVTQEKHIDIIKFYLNKNIDDQDTGLALHCNLKLFGWLQAK